MYNFTAAQFVPLELQAIVWIAYYLVHQSDDLFRKDNVDRILRSSATVRHTTKASDEPVSVRWLNERDGQAIFASKANSMSLVTKQSKHPWTAQPGGNNLFNFSAVARTSLIAASSSFTAWLVAVWKIDVLSGFIRFPSVV